VNYKNPFANVEPDPPRVEGPALEPMFGASSKPFSLLTCKDTHPCRRCARTGFIDGLPCPSCNGTGIAEIRKGSLMYCPCKGCDKSGMDHLPIMQRDPATDPKPEPKNPAPDVSSETNKPNRKAKRKALQPA
jgi:hypothetical protein